MIEQIFAFINGLLFAFFIFLIYSNKYMVERTYYDITLKNNGSLKNQLHNANEEKEYISKRKEYYKKKCEKIDDFNIKSELAIKELIAENSKLRQKILELELKEELENKNDN